MFQKKSLTLLTVCCIMVGSLLFIPCSAKEYKPEKMISCIYPVSLPEGMETLPLSAEYICMRLETAPGELLAITVTSMPKDGELLLDGVQVELYDTILAGKLDRLSYRLNSSGPNWFSFVPVCRGTQKRICVTFNISQEKREGIPAKEVVCMTQPDTLVAAALPHREDMVYITVKKPVQGRAACFEGRCIYIPNKKTEGKDSFVLAALSKDGRVSYPIEVTATIQG